MSKTAHTASSFMQPGAYTDSMNTKAWHTHIPRPYNADTTFNSTMIIGGGTTECGICGMILYDNQS